MNKSIGIIFTLIYIIVIYLLAIIASVHGSDLIIHFATGYLLVAIIALWWIYFFVKRRNFKRSTIILFLSGLGVGLLLIGALLASARSIVKLDQYLEKEHIANTEVFNMKDEILFSKMGNPIGIRLNYQMRFPDNNYFWQGSSMYPEKYLGVNIWTDMHIANQNIEPPMIGTNPLKYEQGKNYNFTVDMIPYFLIQNVDKTKLCINKPPKEYADAFQKLIQNNEAVRFGIGVSGTKFGRITANTYSLKEFYDSAIKEGALECKNQTMYF